MGSRKSNYIVVDRLDGNILFFTITAIMLISYIIRLKVLKNVLNFDMSVIPNTANFYTYYKLVFIITLVSVLLVLFIYRLVKYKVKIRADYILIGCSLVIIASMISTLFSSQREIAILGLYTRTNGLLAYISLFLLLYILSNLKVQAKHLQFLVHAVNIASIGFVVIGIFQFLGIEIMKAQWFMDIYIPMEYKHVADKLNITQVPYLDTPFYWAPSILAHFNYFGAYCSIIFPIITCFAVNESNIRKRIILSLGSIMLFASVLHAQSLGSWAALLGVILIMPFLILNKNNYKNYIILHSGYAAVSVLLYLLTKGRIFTQLTEEIGKTALSNKLMLILLIFLIVYIAILFLWFRFVKNRFAIISITFIIILIVVGSGYTYFINTIPHDMMGIFSSRGYIWHYASELINQNFLIGYGPDSFYYNFPQINPYKAEFLPDVLVDKPHNMYLQYMLDIGIFGLIGFMIILIASFIKYAKAGENEKDATKQYFMLGMQLVIIAYMIQGLINDNHLVIQPILFTLIGVGSALIKNIPIFKIREKKIYTNIS